jgi:hypothetical protein
MSKIVSVTDVTRLINQYEILKQRLYKVYNIILASGGAIPGS